MSSHARGLILALCLALLGCGMSRGPRPSPREQAPRLLRHLPVEGYLAGIDDVEDIPEAEHRDFALRLGGTLASLERGAESAAIEGLLLLAQDQIDPAISLLTSAASRSDDWRDTNDLAVALMWRASKREQPLDLLRALASLQRALELAPDQLETRYNHALVLSQLHLRSMALEAWRNFEAAAADHLRPDHPRRETARAWIRRWRQPTRVEAWNRELATMGEDPAVVDSLVRRFPYHTRLHAQRSLVSRWSAAMEDGDADGARRVLALGHAFGDSLRGRRGDHLVTDLFADLQTCMDGDDAARGCCHEAHGAYIRGVQAFDGGDYATAEKELTRAVRLAPAPNRPLGLLTRYFLRYSLFHGQVAASRDAFAELLDDLSRDGDLKTRYPSFVGGLHLRLGVTSGILGELGEAWTWFERGGKLMESSSGVFGRAFVHVLIAENRDFLGDVEEGWRYRLKAFETLIRSGQSRQTHSMLTEAVQALLRQGRHEMTEPFLTELVHHAEASGNPAHLTDAYRERARYLVRARRLDGAHDALDRARREAERVGRSQRRRHLLATLDLMEAVARVETAPQDAIRRLRSPIEQMVQTENDYHLLPALTARGRAHHLDGRPDLAAADLEEAVRLFDVQRADADPAARLIALRRAQPTFDEWLRILVEQGEFEQALSVAERSRGRFLLDWRERREALPLKAAEIVHRVPEGTRLVEFAQLDEEVLVWIVGGRGVESGRIRLARIPWTAAETRHRTRAYRSALEAGLSRRDLFDISAELHRALIVPLDLEWDEIDHLVVIPDRELLRLPFATLYDAEAGLHLVQRVAVSLAASASLFLAPPPLRSGPPRSGTPGPPLVVVEPELSATEHAHLPPLRATWDEARVFVDLHPDAVVLSGDTATRAAFLQAAPTARLIHFGGHALANAEAPPPFATALRPFA